MTIEYVPYTYLIIHKTTGLWYYGSQYANSKNRVANPENLWKSYFTSSKVIKRLIEEYGINDFDFQIRKTFTSKEKTLEWEQKVLRRITKIDKCININRNANSGFTTLDMIKITDGVVEKMIHKYEDIPDGFRRGRIIEGNKNNRIKIIEKHWITDGKSEKWIDKCEKIPKNWYLGRVCKPTANKIIVNDGVNDFFIDPEMFDKKIHKKGYIESRQTENNSFRQKVKCPYCCIEVNKGNYKQYHDKNCKLNPDSKRSIVGKICIISKRHKKSKPDPKKICEYCGIECSIGNHNRWHGKNCKLCP